MNTLQNNEKQGISEQDQDEYSIMIDEKGKKCWWRYKMSGNGKPLSPLHLFTLFFSFSLFILIPHPPPHITMSGITLTYHLSARPSMCSRKKQSTYMDTTTTKPKTTKMK